jgi:hypothetical protein
MGIRDWFNTQTIKAQNKQGSYLASQMNAVLEGTMKKKADALRRAGKPVTLENLISGCEALERVGLTREDVINVAKKYEEGCIAS